jgi:CelD/BcsL family acetyltransferase involved in cellulose biosynthesis
VNYQFIHTRELTPSLAERWSEIQQTDPTLANPYFSPGFTRAVAAVRDDAYVGILEHEGKTIGFFPFHRQWGGVARPIGLGLSDYHGVIVEPGADWTAEELLRDCKLVRWEFDHLLASQRQFAVYHTDLSGSPIVDVSQGMDAFKSSRDKSGRKHLREIQRKREKLAEQIGPLTFTLHSQDHDILRQLIAWKSLQCRQSGTVDYFSMEWCVRLIEHIHAVRDKHFGGILSCLHAGETLAAAHFVMYSREVWHSWFPAYNHNLEEYSPGLILLLEMIREAADQKMRHIDLGKGLSLYKRRMMTGSIRVAEGCFAIPALRNRIHDFKEGVEQWSRQSRLKRALRIPGRIIKEMERRRRFT